MGQLRPSELELLVCGNRSHELNLKQEDSSFNENMGSEGQSRTLTEEAMIPRLNEQEEELARGEGVLEGKDSTCKGLGAGKKCQELKKMK